MKKKYVRISAILVVMAVLLVGIAPVTAAEKTEFPCTEETIALLDPGTMSFPDGNVHIRGMVILAREEAPDPRDQGYNTVVVNANWGKDGSGPMWGTFRMETDEGGLWKGTWAGMDTGQGSWYNAVGDGFGLYAGMKIWVKVNYGDCQVSFLEH
ncbi:MAG TPA: hypothetical protein VLA49_04965 [Anaerolineales bacterium]|nr:hypothetical protein [Anaerolineales bacterium]